ncbi:hypothetical protein SVIO_008200 [Streptomyces violaceusniger]|uniref:Uncharacterized protein n=1 Tax=Streptomyces violaceusniger TaxID=68280 RepID=A0A4D4KUN9_STRVO|nr:hypothetical protein SVIO_008200 [Streptomyces violaceusniger]
MLLPEGFWMSFTLIVAAGMAATAVAAALIAALASGRTAAHPHGTSRPVSPLPTPAIRSPHAGHSEQVPGPHRRAG